MVTQAMGLAALREPFPPEMVGTLPRGGVQLQYVGHGAVTDRLLTVDPQWSWEPFSVDENGQPIFDVDKQGNPVGLWINLTVLDVTRPGYGSVASTAFDPQKQLIGDAIRNAAMRFGVALDLWIKGTAEDHEANVTTRVSAPQVDAEQRGQIKARMVLLPKENQQRIWTWLEANDLTLDNFPIGWVDPILKALGVEEDKVKKANGDTGPAGARKALRKDVENVLTAFPGSTTDDEGPDAA